MDCRALICEYNDCKLIYENPVILPCGHSLCKHHLTNNHDKFMCYFCQYEHQMPSNGFAINIAINRMIESYMQSSPLRKETIEAFDRLSQTINEYEMIDREKYVYDYFEDIRNKVDLHREELIKKINERSELIIQQLKEKEQKCKLNSANINRMNFLELKMNDMPCLKHSLRIPDLSQNDLNYILSKLNQYDRVIQCQTIKYKSQLIQNQTIEFDETSEPFGDLIVKNNESIFSKDCGQLIRKFDENHVFRKSIQIDENSNRLITSFDDKTIKIYDLTTGICLKTLDKHQDWVSSILLISNNKFVSGSFDKTLKIWDLNSFECLNTLGNGKKVSFMCLISNHEIACGCDDGFINIWNLNSLDVRSIKAHDNCVVCLKLIDTTKLASCSSRIKIWDLQTLKCIQTLDGHSNLICSLESITNEFLLSCSEDQSVKLWNVNTGECLNSIDFDNRVYSIKLFNNDLVAVGLGNGDVIIINSQIEKVKVISSAHESLICQIHLMMNGNLITGSEMDIKQWKFLA